MSALFDSHAHLQDPAFADDLEAVVARAREAGVVAVLVPGYDVASSRQAVALAARFPGMLHAAVGIHPHDADGATAADIDAIAALAEEPGVAAVGETGLDHYRDLSARDAQRRLLGAHLEIALASGKPVSVHSRAAEDAIEEPLAAFAGAWERRHPGRPPGVMHCFGGTPEQAARFALHGFLVSLACTVTYPRNDDARRIAAALPLERLLVETDSPYLPPQDRRGRRNEPAHVLAAVRAVAAERGLAPDAVASTTAENAARMLGLDTPVPTVGAR